MVQDLLRNGLGLLDVRQVRSVFYYGEARAGDRVTDLLRLFYYRRGIFCARDHERGSPDIFESVAHIGVPENFATARVALGGRAAQHDPCRFYSLGTGGAELWRKPALERHVGDRSDTLGPDLAGASIVHVRIESCRGAAQHQALYAVRVFTRQPHADEPADGKPAERHALYLQPVQQRQQVEPKVLYLVGTGRNGRATVPALVVAYEAETFAENGCLIVPHLEG